MNELHELWALIEADLARARQMLPDTAKCHEAVSQYHEFIEHNEFELACDMLERYGEEHSVSGEFGLPSAMHL